MPILTRVRVALRPWRFFVAVLFVLGAIGLRWLLLDLLPGYPFLTFFPAVFAAAILGGWQSGGLALLFSTVFAWYFLVPPENSFVLDLPDGLAVTGFVLTGLFVVWMAALLEREERSHVQEATRANLLFRELKHRVANILQLCASLLQLRARELDPVGQRVLSDAADQLSLMGSIHNRIAGAEEDVPVKDTLAELCGLVSQTAPGLRWEVRCAADTLPRNYLIPVALAVHELLSNAIEHGFPPTLWGSVAVDLVPVATGGWLLTVTDDGRGLPEGFDMAQGHRQGLKIVQALAQQADGHFRLENRPDGQGAQASLLIGGGQASVAAFSP